MVFTDSVPHAALSGQYALEQTFIIPVKAMVEPRQRVEAKDFATFLDCCSTPHERIIVRTRAVPVRPRQRDHGHQDQRT